jgi:prepilin peptidase CpaA
MFQIMNIDITLTILGVLLIIAAVIDLRSHRIPNLLTLPTILLSLSFHTIFQGAHGFVFSLTGSALGIGLLAVPYLMGGMGAGDAKLMGAVGAIVGPKGVFTVFLLTAVAGGICAFFFLLVHRRRFKVFFRDRIDALQLFLLTRRYVPEPKSKAHQRPRLCYGVPIALGSITYIVLNQTVGSFLP